MAQKRMIDKKISVSEQVSNLSIEGQLLFTWMIPHADDLGLLPGSPKIIKAMVVPMWGKSIEDIGILLEDMIIQGLIEIFKYKDDSFYRIKKFIKHQTLKKDRQPQIIIDLPLEEDPKKNWQLCEQIIPTEVQKFQMEDNGNQMENMGFQKFPEVKGSEVKLSEEKIKEGGVEEEKTAADEQSQIKPKKPNPINLTRGQITAYLKAFPGLTNTELKEQMNKCNLTMAMSSKPYDNPGLYFKGWLKKYMDEKAVKKTKEASYKPIDIPDISEEQRQSNLKKIAELKERSLERTKIPCSSL
jgi:hypothetical protein